MASHVPELDLLTLRLFVAVCEERSLNRASAREHIALSALSRRMSELEAGLGLVLLRRHRRGVEPTSAGLSLLQHAHIIMRDIRQMEGELAERVGGVRGVVRLYANTWAIAEYMPRHLHSFLAEYPSISVEIEEGVTNEIIRGVLDRVADIGILSGRVTGEGLRVLPYQQDRLVALMRPDHPLAGRRVLRLADLAPYDIIGAQRGSALEQLVIGGAAEAGAALRIRVRVAGFDTLYRMVEAGLGIGFGPATSAARYARWMRVIGKPLAEPWAARQLSLCLPVGEVPRHVMLFVEHLRRAHPAFADGETSLPKKGERIPKSRV
jgi:DNA-binding transcriptional LysR family regulator